MTTIDLHGHIKALKRAHAEAAAVYKALRRNRSVVEAFLRELNQWLTALKAEARRVGDKKAIAQLKAMDRSEPRIRAFHRG